MIASKYPINSELLTMVVFVTRKVKRGVAEVSTVTIPQYRVLVSLQKAGGAKQTKDIAEDLGITSGTVAATTARLQENGMIERHDDENDRRVVHVSLTEKGRRCIEEVDSVIDNLVAELWKPLGRTLRSLNKLGSLKAVGLRGRMRFEAVTQFHNNDYLEATFCCDTRFLNLVHNHNCSVTEFRMLFELMTEQKEMSSSELAKRLLVKLTDLTNACDNLAKRGFINRSRDKADRRVILIEITNDGYSFARELAPLVDELFAEGICITNQEERDLYLKSAHLIVKNQRKSFRID